MEQRELRIRIREKEKKRLQEIEDSGNLSSGSERKSFRQIQRQKQEMDTEEEEWLFDCVCGVYGTNYVRVQIDCC